MALGSMAILAGTVSSVLFAASMLPMLIKAAGPGTSSSYSRGNLVLANVGNASTASTWPSCPRARSGPCTPSTS